MDPAPVTAIRLACRSGFLDHLRDLLDEALGG